MHGEQGAMMVAAKIVETVPWIDAKYYAATQTMDEARHTEVFAKYLDTKLTGHYPINAHLRMLLDDIINDSRWDMTYLGMQIMVEGLALGAFGTIYRGTREPLLKQLLKMVIQDEARHVHYGVVALREPSWAEATRVTLNGRAGVLAGYWPSGDPRAGWQFRSPGHGGIDWEGVIRALNEIGYDGPLSVDWSDAGMNRDYGAEDACRFVKRLDFEPGARGDV